MTKHILDRQRRRKGSHLAAFVSVAERMLPEGSSPAARHVARRIKGPMNAVSRNRAFLRIERGLTA